MSVLGTQLVNNVLKSTCNLAVLKEWEDMSFPELMFHLAREHIKKRGNKVWLEDGHTGKKLMLDEMERSTKAVTKALKERGLKPGQVVAMVDMSRLETPILALATWLCGGVFNTMDPNPSIATLKANLEALPPAILITSTVYVNKLKDFCDERNIKLWLYDKPGSIADLVPLKENSDLGNVDVASASKNPDDLALVLWSSGSTGNPKGIKLPFSALIGTCLRQREAPISTIIDPEFKYLVCTRMFHFSGFIISLCAPADPGPYSVVFLRNDLISMSLLEQTICTHQPKGLLISYHHTIKMSDQNFEWGKMKNLKVIIPAGARVGEVIETKLKEKMPWIVLSNVYGSIETGGSVAGSLTQSNVGLLYPNTQVKIEDSETKKRCGPNQIGQICAKNDKMLIGYINASNDGIFDSEGYFRMGDMGYYDENGILYFCDRLKDLIRVGDFDVYPVTAEDVLDSHPDVLQSGVFGLADPELGEVCVALVAPKENVELDCESIIEWANHRLELGSRIREAREVNSIPVNNIGKKVRKDFHKVWMMNEKWRKAHPIFLSSCNQYQGEGASLIESYDQL